MSEHERELDPEFLEILAAAARSTGSRLFRVTPRQRAHQPFERVALGPAASGLSVVERQLVDVHAKDLARLLHEAFWLRFDQSFERAAEIARFFKMPDARRWEEASRNAVEDAVHLSRLDRARMLLTQCLRPCVGAPLDPNDLLVVSLRLDDNENARNDLAVGWMERDQLATARRLLAGILNAGPSRQVEPVAWLNVARIAYSEGQLERATSAVLRAARSSSAATSTWMAALACALITGDELDAAAMAEKLDCEPSGWPDGEWYVRFCNSQPVLAPAEKRAARATLQRIHRPLERLSSEVADALLRA